MNRTLINQSYYLKNKVKLQEQRRLKYQSQKSPAKIIKPNNSNNNNYYGAEAIKILLSFKEYMELSKDKRKLWLDFNWTLQDCQSAIKEGLGDITAIMKLEQVAGNLIRDYWTTTKSEVKQRNRNWNSLDYDQQQRLIKYWGREKARVENNFLTITEKLERESKEYLAEIELLKFHEERGKETCLKGNNPCYDCEQRATIRQEVKAKVFDYEKQSSEKGECASCGKLRILDEENELCKNCLKFYE